MPGKFCKLMFVSDQEYFWLQQDIRCKGTLFPELGLPFTHGKDLWIDFPRQLLLCWIKCFDDCAEVYRPDDQYVDVTSGCFRPAGDGAEYQSHFDFIGQARQLSHARFNRGACPARVSFQT
jgi:hypothetical protein